MRNGLALERCEPEAPRRDERPTTTRVYRARLVVEHRDYAHVAGLNIVHGLPADRLEPRPENAGKAALAR